MTFAIGEPPQSAQESLVNIPGTPFYHTPNTPADPWDCDRYPNSPICDGNPLRDSPADFETEIVLDECNLGIQVTPVLGFLALPTLQFVYRNPACIPEEPPRPREWEELLRIPSDLGSDYLCIYIGESYQEYMDHEYGKIIHQYTHEIVDIEAPYQGNVRIPTGFGAPKKPYLLVKGKYKGYQFVENGERQESRYEIEYEGYTDGGITYTNVIGGDLFSFDMIGTPHALKGEYNARLPDGVSGFFLEDGYPPLFKSMGIFAGIFYQYKDEGIAKVLEARTRSGSLYRSGYEESGEYDPFDYLYTYKEIKIFGANKQRKVPPPQTKRKEKECCDMACCSQNDQLLRLILKRIGNLPATVPKNLTDRSKGYSTINSLAEFAAHNIKQIDAVAGYFPIEIKIQDSDLTQEGDQEKKVKLPNIAEALAELTGLLLALRTESDANLNATMRALIEIGSTKQTAILAHDYARANSEFLGYKSKQVEHEVPFTFTPNKQKLDQILKEAKIKVKGFENDDDKDLRDIIYPLLELAARWNAQNYRNLGTSNPTGNLVALLNSAMVLGKEANKFAANQNAASESTTKPKTPEEDFDNFLEDVENGFNTQNGITNPDEPYGYPRENRPRIKRVGNTTSGGGL